MTARRPKAALLESLALLVENLPLLFVTVATVTYAGVPAGAAACSACLSLGLASVFASLSGASIGLCGAGVNLVLASALCLSAGCSWQVVSAVALIAALLLSLLAVTGLGHSLRLAIPTCLRRGSSAGLGLLIALASLSCCGILAEGAAGRIDLANVFDPAFVNAAISVIATLVLTVAHVRGAMLWGILISLVAGIPLGLTQMPSGIISTPDFSLLAAPFSRGSAVSSPIQVALASPELLAWATGLCVLALALEDGHDWDRPPATLRGLSLVGSSLLGTGWVGMPQYEDEACIARRTSAILASAMMTALVFLSPLFASIPSSAICGPLLLEAYGLCKPDKGALKDWKLSEGLPTMVTILGFVLCQSPLVGMSLGFIVYVILSAASGDILKVKPLTWAFAALSLVHLLAFHGFLV